MYLFQLEYDLKWKLSLQILKMKGKSLNNKPTDT
jgi:hypothetical protein